MATFTKAKLIARKYRGIKKPKIDSSKIAKKLKKLPRLEGTNLIVRTPFNIISTIKAFKKLVKQIYRHRIFCFDYEANTFVWHREDFKAFMLAISYKEGQADIIPLYHKETPFTDKQIRKIILPQLARIFADKDIIKIAHNQKYDLHVSSNLGLTKFNGKFVDTMLYHHLLDENARHRLKTVAPSYFPIFFGWDKELEAYQKEHRLKWEDIPLKPMACYAAQDSDVTLRIYNKMQKELLKLPKLQELYDKLILPVFWDLKEAERTGFKISRDKLELTIYETEQILENKIANFHKIERVKKFLTWKNRQEVKKLIEGYKVKIETLKTEAGKERFRLLVKQAKSKNFKKVYTEINIDSPPQITDLLFTKKYGLGLPLQVVKVNGKEVKKRTSNKDYLTELIPEDNTGILNQIIAIRSISKMLSTYMVGIEKCLDKNDLVHTSIMQHGTVSGRLAMSEPPLQTIPVRSKTDDEDATQVIESIRKVFIPLEKDHVIFKFDYSQVEIRVMAEFANEKNMIKLYREGVDIHANTAASMLRLSLEDYYKLPYKEQKLARFRAKAVNFGFLYGMGAKKFKDYALVEYGWVISLEEAEQYRNNYFKLYPGILPYHKKIIAKARKEGYVYTLLGRRRSLPNIKSTDFFLRISDEHGALNSPVQGTAAELTLLAIHLINKQLNRKYERFINTVHDSVLFSVHRSRVNRLAKLCKRIAENLPTKEIFGVKLKKVKLKIDLEIGENWGDLKDYEIT